MTLKKLAGDELLGAVILKNSCRFYGCNFGEWTMDYTNLRSTPSIDFRMGLMRVDETNAEQFCLAMQSQEVLLTDVVRLVKEEQSNGIWVLIDFDRKLFVNGFTEVELEDWVPPGWTGVFDDPIDYLPSELQKLIR